MDEPNKLPPNPDTNPTTLPEPHQMSEKELEAFFSKMTMEELAGNQVEKK